MLEGCWTFTNFLRQCIPHGNAAGHPRINTYHPAWRHLPLAWSETFGAYMPLVTLDRRLPFAIRPGTIWV